MATGQYQKKDRKISVFANYSHKASRQSTLWFLCWQPPKFFNSLCIVISKKAWATERNFDIETKIFYILINVYLNPILILGTRGGGWGADSARGEFEPEQLFQY